jgi:hypothetical protein
VPLWFFSENALNFVVNALWYRNIKVAVLVLEDGVFLVQDLIGGDGLDLIKLYLAPVRTFWKGVPEGSQVSSVRHSAFPQPIIVASDLV